MTPTLLSLFAGIGGLDLAAHWAGFETIRFVEKEPFCKKVLAKHWPHVPIDDDVFTSHPGYADVVCGGFPCQPFSVAGQKRGKDDERYLLPEMLRIVKEVKPYAVLFENVPGFASLNNGTEFKYLLGALAEMGFDAQWGHIRASDVGAGHPRDRWFLVACTQYDGHTTAAIRGGHEAQVYNYPQGQDSARQSTRSDSTGIISERIMENTTSTRLEGGKRQELQERRQGFTINEHGRQTQPRIRGTAHGLPGRLDFVGFPARPGEPQHAYEPPHTAPSTPTTNARIKALGNAVVPQCAYPIFAAIAEWLAEIQQEKAA